MTEAQRQKRNADKLAECHPAFAKRAKAMLKQLEDEGLRPRIQEAWRSPQDQLEAFLTGHSKLRFGFHNVTGADGTKEALALDVLDDDSATPADPSTRYLLMLTRAARAAGLATGILWGLPEGLRAGVERTLTAGDMDAEVKVGWDPCHVQATGVSPAQAQHGARPG